MTNIETIIERAEEGTDVPEIDKVERKGQIIERKLTETQRPEGFGRCSTCSNFVYQRRTYLKENIDCAAYFGEGKTGFRPSREDPIKDCYHYYPAGQMTLRDMYTIATIIDVDKKGPIGFGR